MAMAMTAVRRFSRSQLQASYRALEAPGLVFSSTRFSSSVRIASGFCPPFSVLSVCDSSFGRCLFAMCGKLKA